MNSKLVLARKNPNGSYSPQNCYWRLAKTKREEKMGIEELWAEELEELPFSEEDIIARKKMPKQERRLFDIWFRMILRSKPERMRAGIQLRFQQKRNRNY